MIRKTVSHVHLSDVLPIWINLKESERSIEFVQDVCIWVCICWVTYRVGLILNGSAAKLWQVATNCKKEHKYWLPFPTRFDKLTLSKPTQASCRQGSKMIALSGGCLLDWGRKEDSRFSRRLSNLSWIYFVFHSNPYFTSVYYDQAL